MSIKKLIENRRTIRKYTDQKIPDDLLISFVHCARLAPSGANLQPLKYVIIRKEINVNALFPYVKWAGYLKGSYTPEEGQRPVAYIAVLQDRNIPSTMAQFDAGAALMSLSLVAEEEGIGSCIMGAIDRPEICKLLDISDDYELLYLVSLGYKGEQPVYTDLEGDNVRYYIEKQRLVVPKRKSVDVLLKIL